MAATLTTMRATVKLKVGNKGGIDSTLDANINNAVLYVLWAFRPQEEWATVTFNTANGTSEYTFNQAGSALGVLDVYAFLMIRDMTKDREVLRGGMRHYNRLRQDTAVSSTKGSPRRWTRNGNKLVLYARIPDSVISIKATYLKRPAVMTAGPPAVDFPLNEEWQRPVEEYAAFLTWSDLNEGNKAATKLQAYQALVSTMDRPEAIEDEAPEAAIRPYVDMSGAL